MVGELIASKGAMSLSPSGSLRGAAAADTRADAVMQVRLLRLCLRMCEIEGMDA
jgi:hypothetical protein